MYYKRDRSLMRLLVVFKRVNSNYEKYKRYYK